jgi:antitoxin HicB
MQTWTFPALVERDEDGAFNISFPDVPEALTGAMQREGALALASDALEEALLAYLADGRPLPLPRAAVGDEVAIALDPVTAARCALALAMAEQRVSNVALAAKLGRSEGAVRRLIDGRSGVKIDTVLEALRAVGREAVLAVA